MDDTGSGQVLLWGAVRRLPGGRRLQELRLFPRGLDRPVKTAQGIADALVAKYSFDLTTAYYESVQKIYEEFFMTTTAVDDLYKW